MIEVQEHIPALTASPSFNSYSSERLGEIVAKSITEEEEKNRDAAVNGRISADESREQEVESNGADAEDDDFEFSLARDPDTSPISADEIFANGQIRPTFPIFNRDLLFADENDGVGEKLPEKNEASIRLPLRKLLIDERDHPSSSFSLTESDDLSGVPEGSYCVWTPRSVPPSPNRCKKSNSTGSSKRWRFRDLLHRSSSDGKETFVFLSSTATASPKEGKPEAPKPRRNSGEVKAAGKAKAGQTPSAHEMHYVRNRAMKEGDRRRSFLPYRQGIVGFFANVNGLSRTLHPF